MHVGNCLMTDLVRDSLFKNHVSGIYLINHRVYIDIVIMI